MLLLGFVKLRALLFAREQKKNDKKSDGQPTRLRSE